MSINRSALNRQLDNARKRGGSGRNFYRPKIGRNHIRILPFKHIITQFDILANRVDPNEFTAGDEIELLFADFDQVGWGRAGRNCLPDQSECPLWQSYFGTKDKEKKKERRPRRVYAFNIVDMDEVQRGVQLATLSSSWVEGERETSGAKKGLGILDYYLGFEPDVDGEDEDNAEDEEGGGGGALPAIQAYGDALFGLGGRDIIVKTIKKSETCRLNHVAKNGAIVVRKAEACAELEALFATKVTDLWDEPLFFPGFSNDGKHLWPVAADLVAARDATKGNEDDTEEDTGIKGARETAQVEEDTSDEEEVGITTTEPKPEPEAAKPKTTKKKAAKKKTTKKKPDPIKLSRGQSVVVTDKMNEDNTEMLSEDLWTRYVGVFDSYEGAETAIVTLPVEAQDDEDVQATLQEAYEAESEDVKEKGGPFYKFPVDFVTPAEE